MASLELIILIAVVSSTGLLIVFFLRQRQAQLSQPPQPPPSPQPTDATLPLPVAHNTSSHQTATSFPPLFRAAVAAFDAGLVLINAEGQVFFLNTQAEDLLNIDFQTAQGQGIMGLLRDYQADALVRDVLTDGEPRETTLNPVLSGRTLRLRCMPLDSAGHNEIEGVVLLIRDVTQISMLERARRDLVANVSHELRTPLASLKLLVETLQSEPPPSVARHMLMQAAQEIDVVTQLVDELHELSQIESGRVTLQLAPATIDTVVEHTLERMRPQTDRKHLYIHAYVSPDDPPVLMDDKRIGQVLLNLLHNAVKFTSDHGEISVRTRVIVVNEDTPRLGSIERDTIQSEPAISVAQAGSKHTEHTMPFTPDDPAVIELPTPHPAGSWMLVSVSDTGIGIPASDLPRIFERFYKVDRSRNRNAGGTGLGLAIAKHLIEGHGGRLWANSTEGRGSTFYFTLPMG